MAKVLDVELDMRVGRTDAQSPRHGAALARARLFQNRRHLAVAADFRHCQR